jgi:vanillate O-demethylase monooxygenase subunit
MSYLFDCWYMAGWAEEFDNRSMIARTICDIPIVVFRTSGGIAALADRCPHRFAPLSRGRFVDGSLQCGYHGLTFGAGGQCIHNPHGPISGRMQVRAFPAVEVQHAIWVWIGAPERADPSLLPDFSFLNVETESAANRGGYIHGQANYLLYVDNLMDLSHANFLHPDSLGRDSFVGADQTIKEDDRTLTVRWSRCNLSPAPYEVELGRFDKDARFDQHTEVQWYPPGAMRLAVTVDAPGATPNTHTIAHVMTPETEKTVHYFYASTRDFRVDDLEFNRQLGELRDRVFKTEDSPMIEAVQKRMGTTDLFSLKPLLLRTDAAAVRVRRKLASMIAEQGEAAQRMVSKGTIAPS